MTPPEVDAHNKAIEAAAKIVESARITGSNRNSMLEVLAQYIRNFAIPAERQQAEPE